MTPSGMTRDQFRAWRKKMQWSQMFAAQKLGICIASVQSYERGSRSDKENPIVIPLLTALAMSAIANGLGPWGGGK